MAQPSNYRNWWGQFAQRDGDFNDATAQRFRNARGVFPFRALLCHASLENIDDHITARYGLNR